jgi:hypothetical protein
VVGPSYGGDIESLRELELTRVPADDIRFCNCMW